MLAACGSDQAVEFTTAEPPEPASVRLFMEAGDVTAHVPLDKGRTHELEVRLYAANGRRLTGYDDHFEITIEVQPASLASVADVVDRPLVKTLIASAPAGEARAVQRDRRTVRASAHSRGGPRGLSRTSGRAGHRPRGVQAPPLGGERSCRAAWPSCPGCHAYELRGRDGPRGRVHILPRALEPYYGDTRPFGVLAYLHLRPRAS